METYPCSWIGRLNIVNTTQSDLQTQCNLYQNPNDDFCRNRIPILKFVWDLKDPGQPKIFQDFSNLEKKKSKIERLTLFDFNIYCKTMVIKTVWYWYKDRHVDQWNRIKIPKMNPDVYGQMIFDKGAQIIQWGKESLFNKWCGETGISTCKRMKLDP